MEKVFRGSLFGYSKKSVAAYIAGMNEEFSQKLLEKDLAYKHTVQELKEQLERLRQEKEQLQAGRQEVAGALIDAKAFAAELRERTEAENRAQRSKNEAYCQAQRQKLQEFSDCIDTLRDALNCALKRMDAELEQLGLRGQTLRAQFQPEEPDGQTAAAPLEEDLAVQR